MINIFENAYFGKLYRTRDGRKAAFVNWDDRRTRVFLYVKERDMEFYGEEMYELDGTTSRGNKPHNIVSEWIEPINEEKLDMLAEHWCPESGSYRKDDIETQKVIRNAYKAGYYKGWEGKK